MATLRCPVRARRRAGNISTLFKTPVDWLTVTDTNTDQTGVAPTVSIRERGKAERRARIVETARRIATTGGVEALSMRMLSVESGVSLPTIYNLIGGRDEVLAAVLAQIGETFEAEVALSSTNATDRCFEIADRLLDTMMNHSTLARSIVAEGLTSLLSESVSSPFRRYGLALLVALTEAAEQGDLDAETQPILVVEQMASLTAVRIFRWATDDVSPDMEGKHLRSAVIHGIGLILAGVSSEKRRAQVIARVHEAQSELLGGSDE